MRNDRALENWRPRWKCGPPACSARGKCPVVCTRRSAPPESFAEISLLQGNITFTVACRPSRVNRVGGHGSKSGIIAGPGELQAASDPSGRADGRGGGPRPSGVSAYARCRSRRSGGARRGLYAFLRRIRPAIPASPLASASMLPGSGTTSTTRLSKLPAEKM